MLRGRSQRRKKLPCTAGHSRKAQALLLIVVFLLSVLVTLMRFLNLSESPYQGTMETVIMPLYAAQD